MVHLPEIVDIIVNDIPKAGYQQTARKVNANVLAGVDITNDTDAYAYLGNWSWDYGLGQAGLWVEQEIVCLGGWEGTWIEGMMGRVGSGTLLGELGEWGTLEDCIY